MSFWELSMILIIQIRTLPAIHQQECRFVRRHGLDLAAFKKQVHQFELCSLIKNSEEINLLVIRLSHCNRRRKVVSYRPGTHLAIIVGSYVSNYVQYHEHS